MKDEQMRSELNEVQARGVSQYELTEEQVRTPYFGLDILNAIDSLKRKDSSLTNKTAFAIVEGLDYYQIKGFLNYRLTLDQVLTPNFGEHTLRAIDDFMYDDPAVDYETAFLKVRELDYNQYDGILRYDLTREQVRTPKFSGYTLTAIDVLKEKDPNLDNKTAFSMVEGLDVYQLKGVYKYGLTRDQVLHPDFSNKTLNAIDYFKDYNPNTDNKTTFHSLLRLEDYQILGVSKHGLSRGQVLEPNFREHLNGAMLYLKNKYPDMSNQEAFSKVKWLAKDQCLGVLVYKLSRAEVLGPNFGKHTIDAIEYLKRKNPSLNNKTAFSIVEGLDKSKVDEVYKFTDDQLNQDPKDVRIALFTIAFSEEELDQYQKRGILEYGLDLDQVRTPNFGSHTLLCISNLKSGDSELDSKTAFAKVEGLDFYQCTGVLSYALTKEVVRSPYFGQQTLQDIDHFKRYNFGVDNETAFFTVIGLQKDQVVGVSEYGLSREQVLDPNFGEFTFQDIDYFRAYNPNVDNKTAFFIVDGLNAHQLKGVSKYGLDREQVLYPNFSKHTLLAIDFLTKQDPDLDSKSAFNIVKGLDLHQTRGYLGYELSKDEVLAPNFGEHTLCAIDDLMAKDPDLNIIAAFNKVRGLDQAQTKGVLEYELSRDQVRIPYFGYHTLIAMDNLKRNYPNLVFDVQTAFSKVKYLDPDQARGVSEYGLTRKQIEIQNFGEHILEYIDDKKKDKSVNLDDHDYDHKQEDLDDQQFFEEVAGLYPIQIYGMVMYKLTRDQVEDRSYNEDILKAMDRIHSAIPELEVSILYKTVINLDPGLISTLLGPEFTQEDVRKIVSDVDQAQAKNTLTSEINEEQSKQNLKGDNDPSSEKKDLNKLTETVNPKRKSYTSRDEKLPEKKTRRKLK